MGLFENMRSEPASKLNLREPVTVNSKDSVRDVVQSMREKNLGCAILVDEEQRPVGIFTESMLTQIMANNPAALEDPVELHAADRWAQISLSEPILSVLEALEVKNVRFLPVVDTEGRVVGLTGQKGLMEYVADHFPGQVMVQRVGQKPSMHEREGA